jgi:hypothetical protein
MKRMIRFLLFGLITAGIIYSIYQSHFISTYVYHTNCNGITMGSPICMFVLDVIRLSAQSVYNFWLYASTIISGLILYAFNRLFSEIGDIREQLNATGNYRMKR